MMGLLFLGLLATSAFLPGACGLPVLPRGRVGRGLRSAEPAPEGRPLTPVQRRFLEDFTHFGFGSSSLREGSTRRILERMSPGAGDRLRLVLERQTLELDPRPDPGSGRGFKDFFAALDGAVSALAAKMGSPEQESHLDVLFAAQRRGDLDLNRSRLAREADPSFTDERKTYILQAVARMTRDRPAPKRTPLAPVVQSAEPGCRRRQALVAPSLLPFKRGDLDALQGALNRYAQDGFRRVAVFHAVHYAGGAYEEHAPSFDRVPPRPQNGRDYRFEILDAPTTGELRRLVVGVLAAGLELSYVPHLESIVTMTSFGEAEWRIRSAIPLDDAELYERMYAPVVEALNAHRTRLAGRPSISLGAEVDRSTLYYPDAALRLAERLRRELTLERSQYTLEWNPNGDFNALSNFTSVHRARGLDGCKSIETFFLRQVDVVGPSLYDAYGHVAPRAGRPTFAATRAQFLKNFEDYLGTRCGRVGRRIAQHHRDRFSIGEFSLQGPRASDYRAFFEEALNATRGESGRINLWTSGQPDFDPLARDPRAPGKKSPAEIQIEKFRRC